jgi:hypothetical protein
MHDHRDWVKERRESKIGGRLEMHLSGRYFTVEFLYAIPPARYAIDREHAYNEKHARVDNEEFSQIVAALKMATDDCFGADVTAFVPSSSVFEIYFQPGMAPFGEGRRVFIEGRLADLMRPEIGYERVVFEYPVRVDGAAPQWVKMRANTITGLEPVA